MSGATTTSSLISFSAKPSHHSFSKSPLPISKISIPFSLKPQKPSYHRCHPPAPLFSTNTSTSQIPLMKNPPRIQLSSPDSLPTSPTREPTSSSKPSSIKASKQSSLTQEAHSWRSTNSTISNVLPRHKQGGVFAS
ncbi:unnamed protein product [Brassica rapa]|uniref:Uncharacterized protein n=1 Tax=Brassica campestris TaxID=3711 RepID=A0A3P5YFD7_BRACM|nr:unnamed protein product [Brassica rapa]VDC66452.1 unnamed protein product [Brassica rapa]